ncbi:alpha/beta hydrolase [bacterium]|nr:alpha/beta hydrolase [bacterium]
MRSKRSYRSGVKVTGLMYLFVCLFGFHFQGCRADPGAGDENWHKAVRAFRHDLSYQQGTIHYIDIGQGTPLVLVHGFADSSFCWFAQYQTLLGAGYRLIIVDQPGLGRSSTPPPTYKFSLENQAGGVKTVMDQLGLTTCDLIGHSMGGGISLYLAQQYPELVRSIIVIDPACFRIPRLMFLQIPGIMTFLKVFKGHWLVRTGLRQAFYEPDKVTETMVVEYSRNLNRQHYLQTLHSLLEQYFSPGFDRMVRAYPMISQPVLILWGDHDTWVPFEFGPRLQSLLKCAEVITLTEAGHNAHQEQPEQANQHILSFLERNKVKNLDTEVNIEHAKVR